MFDFKAYASSSSGNCYSLTDGETDILIEIGIPWKRIQIATNFKANSFDFAIVSHEHGDHAGFIPEAVKAGVDCYLSEDIRRRMRLSGHRIHIIEPLKQFTVKSLTILPFPLEHDVPNMGFIIESKHGGKLLFATDTFYIRYRFKGLAILAIECNYSIDTIDPNIHPAQESRLKRAHMSLETLKDFIRANDMRSVREIHLLHLSDGNSDEALFKAEIEKLTGKPVYVCAKQ